MLVLDGSRRIRRFTPVAGTLLNLIAGDVGRPFSDIASTFGSVDWNELLSDATRTGRLAEREVIDRAGHPYALRVRPYKTGAGESDGVLVILLDTEALKATLSEAQKSRDQALRAEQFGESILNSLSAHVAVLSPDGTILKTNEAWDSFARENGAVSTRAVGLGANYPDACRRAAAAGVADAQAALEGIQAVLSGSCAPFQLEYPCHSSTEQRWFLMNVGPLKGAAGGAVVTHTNITSRKPRYHHAPAQRHRRRCPDQKGLPRREAVIRHHARQSGLSGPRLRRAQPDMS